MKKFYLEHFEGVILGGAIGDAFGASYENNELDDVEISIDSRPWFFTDDTQLTLATCESILVEGQINPKHIAKTFSEWFSKNRISFMGASTLKALIELQMGGHWASVGRKGEFSAGNGAAMRIAPLTFFLDLENFTDRLKIHDVCYITHQNEEAYCGALAVVLGINYHLKEMPQNSKNFIEYIICNLPDSRVKDNLIRLNSRLKDSIESIGFEFGTSGFVSESIPFSIFASAKIFSSDLESIFKSIIISRGDTDTNCSIAGQVCGAFLKKDGLSDSLTQKLQQTQNYKLVNNILVRFHDFRQ